MVLLAKAKASRKLTELRDLVHFVDGFSSPAYVGTSTLAQEGLLDYFHMSILLESIGLGYGLKILAP